MGSLEKPILPFAASPALDLALALNYPFREAGIPLPYFSSLLLLLALEKPILLRVVEGPALALNYPFKNPVSSVASSLLENLSFPNT